MKKRPRFFVPLILILLTLLFIFTNSLRPAPQSTGQSTAVQRFLAAHFDVERPPMNWLYDHIRKVAHFCEFMLLGCEGAAFLWLNFRRRYRPAAFFFCALAAMADEGIQYFVPGRSAQWSDVALDTAGATAGILLTAAVFLVIRLSARAGKPTQGEKP